jgi:adenylyltransferase/sulfurtransferase
MGCLQATEVLKILLGRSVEEICTGRVLVFHALQMKFGQLGLAREPDREVITELIDYKGFCAGPKLSSSSSSTPATVNGDASPTKGRTMDEAEQPSDTESSFRSIQPKDCLQKLYNGWPPYVLDVRLQTEHDIVALPFTDKVSPHRTVQLEHVPSKGDILVYCKSGVRSKKAIGRLISLGIDPTRLYNLDGGIMKWQKDIDPSMPRY